MSIAAENQLLPRRERFENFVPRRTQKQLNRAAAAMRYTEKNLPLPRRY
jgi:hypothetical protein